jgi:hypothetical protein
MIMIWRLTLKSVGCEPAPPMLFLEYILYDNRFVALEALAKVCGNVREPFTCHLLATALAQRGRRPGKRRSYEYRRLLKLLLEPHRIVTFRSNTILRSFD